MAKSSFTRHGPFKGIPTLLKKGKRVIGAAPCETDGCSQEINICIGGDNWLTATCPQSGCGTTVHGRSTLRARHELARLTASDRIAHEDTLRLCHAALDAMESNAPDPEPSDQLSFVTATRQQSEITAQDSEPQQPEEVEEPIHAADEPAVDLEPVAEDEEDPLAAFMEEV